MLVPYLNNGIPSKNPDTSAAVTVPGYLVTVYILSSGIPSRSYYAITYKTKIC